MIEIEIQQEARQPKIMSAKNIGKPRAAGTQFFEYDGRGENRTVTPTEKARNR